jgi:hypothetical protein
MPQLATGALGAPGANVVNKMSYLRLVEAVRFELATPCAQAR